MKIQSQRDFAAGAVLRAFGVTFAWGAATYNNVGSGARMGPGYFRDRGPADRSQAQSSRRNSLIVHTGDGDPISAIAWRPLLFIIGANLLFGVLLGGLPATGLPPMG